LFLVVLLIWLRMNRFPELILGTLLTLLWATAAFPLATGDGPYVFIDGDDRVARWLCDGELREQPLDHSGRIEPACGAMPVLTLESDPGLAPDTLPQPERWAALSDIHGQADLFLALLKAHGVIDTNGHWNWSDGVLVIAGDVLDRGPEQMEALWTIYRLAQEARAAGGRVELLLGNHEAMVLAGDLRYLHPRYLETAKRLGRSYDQLFAADTELGNWLRRRATVLKLGDSLLVHGGLHPQLASGPLDIAELNASFRAGLGVPRGTPQTDPAVQWLHGSDGPVWYRGYFVPELATQAQIEALLQAAGVRRIVVGHTTLGAIGSLHGGRVIGIDSGIKNGDYGELLIWQEQAFWRGMPDGRREPLSLAAEQDSADQ
jgi:hypothetical protein